MPEVSIIIPAYNAAAFLPAAINSVLAQTFHDMEIIIIDDGSTDNTKDVVASFGNILQYFYTPNAGPSAARNFGIMKAKGRFIAFLDADDWWFPHKLAIQIGILSRNPAISFVCSDWFNGKTGEEPQTSTLSNYKAWKQAADFDLMLEENFVNTSTLVVERQNLLKVGAFAERIKGAEDMHLWLRLLDISNAFICKKILAFRRFHLGNTSATLEYFVSQVDMIAEVLTWPTVKATPSRFEKAIRKHRALLVSLAYKFSTLRMYREAALTHKRLCASPFHRVPSCVRCLWFALLHFSKEMTGMGNKLN